MPTIDELKLALVKAREENEKVKMHAADLWGDVEETEAYKKYKLAELEFKASSDAMLVADKALRDAALQEFGYKTVGEEISPGIKIKMRHKIHYDLNKVIEWAKTEARNLFKFDVKAFEDAAKKGTLYGAPFEKYDEPYVELATKNEDFQLPQG
jgi:hypothetical protein